MASFWDADGCLDSALEPGSMPAAAVVPGALSSSVERIEWVLTKAELGGRDTASSAASDSRRGDGASGCLQPSCLRSLAFYLSIAALFWKGWSDIGEAPLTWMSWTEASG